MLNPGELDRRIVIQRSVETPDSSGQPVQTWSVLAERWAKVTPIEARERYRIEAPEAVEIATFLIRYLAGVDPTDRILYEDKSWNIRGLAEIGRREWLEITAEAKA